MGGSRRWAQKQQFLAATVDYDQCLASSVEGELQMPEAGMWRVFLGGGFAKAALKVSVTGHGPGLSSALPCLVAGGL